MKETLLKIFYTIVLLAVGITFTQLTTQLVNTCDDLIALAGFILLAGMILLIVYLGYRIWIKPKTQKQNG